MEITMEISRVVAPNASYKLPSSGLGMILVGGFSPYPKNDGLWVRQLGLWKSQLNGTYFNMFQTTKQY